MVITTNQVKSALKLLTFCLNGLKREDDYLRWIEMPFIHFFSDELCNAARFRHLYSVKKREFFNSLFCKKLCWKCLFTFGIWEFFFPFSLVIIIFNIHRIRWQKRNQVYRVKNVRFLNVILFEWQEKKTVLSSVEAALTGWTLNIPQITD